MSSAERVRFHAVHGADLPEALYRQVPDGRGSSWHEMDQRTGRWIPVAGRPPVTGPGAPQEISATEAQQVLDHWVGLRLTPGGGRLDDRATPRPTGPPPMRDRLGWLIFAVALVAILAVAGYRAVVS